MTPTTKPSDLRVRSRQLRAQARGMHPLVARAMRRRACELDLRAWVIEIVQDDRTSSVVAVA